jgi:bla regulator protein BlaR1
MNSPFPLLEDAFRWTLGSSLRVSVLIVLVLLAQTVLARRLTAGLRYGLSILVLIGLLMPVVPPSVLSLANLLRTKPHALESSLQIPLTGVTAKPAEPSIVPDNAPAPIAVQNTEHMAPPAGTKLSLSQAGAMVWLSVAFGLLAVGVWRYRKWTRRMRNGRPIERQDLLALLEACKAVMGVSRAVALVEVDRLSTPAIFGVWRIRLLLPTLVLRQLDHQELRMVFLHELAHVRRGDVLLNWVLMLVQFLHWFNPLVLLALHRLRADRELVCDALVLHKISRDQNLEYGHVLLKLMEVFSREPAAFATAVPVVSSQREVKRRLIMIRDRRQARWATRCGTALLAFALGCATLTRAVEEKIEATADPIVVTIDKAGALYLGPQKAPVSVERLKQVLRSAVAKAPDTRLVISADQKAPFAEIVRVMDAAKDAKVESVNAVTDNGASQNGARNEKPRAGSGSGSTNNLGRDTAAPLFGLYDGRYEYYAFSDFATNHGHVRPKSFPDVDTTLRLTQLREPLLFIDQESNRLIAPAGIYVSASAIGNLTVRLDPGGDYSVRLESPPPTGSQTEQGTWEWNSPNQEFLLTPSATNGHFHFEFRRLRVDRHEPGVLEWLPLRGADASEGAIDYVRFRRQKLSAAEAGDFAQKLANEQARTLYKCQPFRDGPPAKLVEGRWMWHDRKGRGTGDIEATIRLDLDGANPQVEVIQLDGRTSDFQWNTEEQRR